MIGLYLITILEIANIPLNIFAFIGGALALSIGIGSQSLTNNFFSSILIMLERPIKIGDVVEIDGLLGMVHSIGLRCVTLRTFSNIEISVPNSRIMQTILINWTLKDNMMPYQAIITIVNNEARKLDPSYIIGIFKTMIIHLEINADLFLTKIDKNNLIFLMNIEHNIEQFPCSEALDNMLNLSLLNYLEHYSFTTEYRRLLLSKAA
jgi:small-conductance mechanosensitive channel